MTHAKYTSTSFFMCIKPKMLQWLNNNKKKSYEITTKSLKPKLKKLNGKGNGVTQLFIKLYIKKKQKCPCN